MSDKKKKRFRSAAKDMWRIERLWPQYLNQKHSIFADRRTKRQKTRSEQDRRAIKDSDES